MHHHLYHRMISEVLQILLIFRRLIRMHRPLSSLVKTTLIADATAVLPERDIFTPNTSTKGVVFVWVVQELHGLSNVRGLCTAVRLQARRCVTFVTEQVNWAS